jgi:MFS family permease
VRFRNPVGLLAARTGVAYGWFVVACSFALSAMVFGTMYSYTVFFESLRGSFGGSYATLSLLFGLQTFVAFGSAGVFGFAIDRHGVAPLLVVAAVLLGVGLGATSQLSTFSGILAAYGGVAGLGLGIVYVVAYTTPARWFRERSATATGIAVSGTGVGIFAVPPAANRAVLLVGWRRAYLLLLAVFLVVLAVSVLTFQRRPTVADPADAQVPAADVTVALRSPLFGLVFLAYLCAFVPSYAVSVYLVEFALSVGLPRWTGVWAVSGFGLAGIGVKFATGPLSDRAGIAPVMAGFVTVMCLATIAVVTVPTQGGLLAAAVTLGMGYGGVDALLAPLVRSLFGADRLSSVFGAVTPAFGVVGGLTPIAVGVGFARFGSFVLPFVLAAGVGAVAVIAFAGLAYFER